MSNIRPKLRPPSPADKEHLKEIVLEYLSHPEHLESMGADTVFQIIVSVCAAHGKFDFSVALEHASEIVEAEKFLNGTKNGISLRTLAICCAIYWFLDIPLPNSFCFSPVAEMEWLLFGSCCSSYTGISLPEDKKYLPEVSFTKAIRSVIDQERITEFFIWADMDPESEILVRDAAYAALLNEKWTFFAGLCSRYDLTGFLDMEKVFRFWSDCLLAKFNNRYKVDSPADPEFILQWKAPERYPLHRMMTDYGKERCIPLLFQRGFLYPEVISELWDKGISFDQPLASFYHWEALTFPVFSFRFGNLSALLEPVRKRKFIQHREWKFLKTLESAEFFNEYAASHPRKGPVQKCSGTVRRRRRELTEAQIARLEQDQSRGIRFSADYRRLMKYRDTESAAEYAIPDFVTSVSREAFSTVRFLKKVILPETMSVIGKRSFFGGRMAEVCFPAALRIIEEEAFRFSRICRACLPEGVTGIGREAFQDCDALESVFLPDTLTELGEFAFYCCSKLTSVRLSASLVSLPRGVFKGCSELESIAIPDGVQSVDIYAFDHCTNLRFVEVPSGIQIHEKAFGECSPDLQVIFRAPAEKS